MKKHPLVAFTLTVVAVFSFAHSSHASDTYTHVSGTLNTSTTWAANSGHVLDSAYTIASGVVLTILDGAVVKFKATSTDLVVNGTLIVSGSSTNKTIFTSFRDDYATGTLDDTNGDGASTTPATGDWRVIRFSAGSSSTISNAVIRYGGFLLSGLYQADIYNNGGNVTVINTEVASSTNYGVRTDAGTTTISSSELHNNSVGAYETGGTVSVASSTIHDNVSYGFDVSGGKFTISTSTLTSVAVTGRVTYAAGLTTFSHWGNTATGTGNHYFLMSSTASNDDTWSKDNDANDIPYVVDAVTVAAGKTITINPGVVVKLNRLTTSGSITANGTLNVNGTDAQPVYFTSYKDDSLLGDSNNDGTATAPAAGDWKHLGVTSGGTMTLNNAIVRYGGNTGAGNSKANVYNTTGTLTIANTTIASSTNYGVYMTSGTTVISSSTIRNNTNYGIFVTSGTLSVAYSDISNQKEGIHITGGTVSGGSNSIHDNTVYGAFKSAAPTSTLFYNYWGSSTGPRTTSTNPSGGGNAVSDYIDYNPYLQHASVCSGCSFYAQIKNTGSGRWLLRSDPSNAADSNEVKQLPEDWVLYVSSTASPTGTPTVAGGYFWYEVTDMQDASDTVSGWMQGENASGTTYYLPYTSSLQSDFQATSSQQITASTDRATVIRNAMSHFYEDNSVGSNSLYSSEAGNNDLSILKTRSYASSVILGVAVRESANAQGVEDFDNHHVSFDYGHGVMQLTFDAYNDTLPNQTASYDHRGVGSFVHIGYSTSSFPCPAVSTTTYTKCYTDGGATSTTPKPYKHFDGIGTNPIYMEYSNTNQSIYANVKDGMRMLQENYNNPSILSGQITTSSPPINGIVYTATEREIISVTEAYNGACGYVNDVASTTDNVGNYFPGVTTSTITQLLQHMHTAGTQMICAQLHSPGDLSIRDSKGRVVGVVNGEGRNDFPWAIYDKDAKWVKILFPGDEKYTFQVQGTGDGVYGLDITLKYGEQRITVHADETVPIKPNEVHSYTIDKDALLNGQKGVTVSVDRNGDGAPDETITSGQVLTGQEFSDNR